MIKLLKQTERRRKETLFLAALSLACFTLSVLRFLYTGKLTFLFLNWNLFLAFLPWAFSTCLISYPQLQKNKLLLSLLVASWLLFFPNAPYILTDLFHLRTASTMPIWADLVLILAFAWTGLMFGFMSLWDIERIFGKFISTRLLPLISLLLLFMSSFGVYVGRYLRWNSWEVLTQPNGIYQDISDRIIHPMEHPRTWGMTVLMFFLLSMIYFSLRLIRQRDSVLRTSHDTTPLTP